LLGIGFRVNKISKIISKTFFLLYFYFPLWPLAGVCLVDGRGLCTFFCPCQNQTMKSIQFQAEYLVYESEAELPLADQQLLAQAKQAAKGAYAPYSRFNVGAAALLDDGTVILGSNQENAAYPVTMCAERNAIFAAAAQFPHKKVVKVAITVQTEGQRVDRPVPPCGSCRQALYESELRYAHNIELILQGDCGEVYHIPSIKSILPLLFDAKFL
jgi:cytidine deaminase